ncbi:hypothetical protein [Sulfurimonas sp. HSL-1716]|uniref:hypothetical protein n=1 Tax=Hydrocurvibacter sulfurireducens TaxID=3131937 RepID=UPI0031FA336E
MLKKLLGKDKESISKNDSKQLAEYISKAGLTELRSLLLGQITRFKVDEYTIIEVLKKLTYQDERTKKRFLEKEDNDTKLKKAFETVITAAKNKKISVEAVELIEKFITMYRDLIEDYDARNKDIYMHKLTKAAQHSLSLIEQILNYLNKMSVIGKD